MHFSTECELAISLVAPNSLPLSVRLKVAYTAQLPETTLIVPNDDAQ